ncbi:MAG: restriction endonuclease subunit S [Erysipelotrichaceae bacterium]|nr:restriction endonuclease subunit S [Erysipelotrichaceae bacterium]
MAEWVECTIGDLCDTISDTYKGNDENVILVNTSDVLEGKVLNHTQVPNKNLKGQFKKTFRKNDILFSEIRPANKRFAFIDFEDTSNYIASTKLMVLRHNAKVIPEYLYAILKSNYILAELQHLAETRSGTFPQITFTSELAPMKVNLPDKKTQKQIVSILSSIEQKMDSNETINNNLEQQAMALFKSWFIDYEPFDRQVPTTWKCGVLGDFVEIKRGGSPRPIQNFLSDSGLHWLKISDATGISSPFINEIKEYIIEEGLKKTVFLKAGSLVLSNSATPGLPKILDIDTCIHDGWLYFPSSKFSNEYLYLYFKHIRDNLVALGNGSVFTNLKTDILKNYPTNLPTDEVLNEFDEIIKPIFSMILSKTRESKRLTEIRDTLLPRLMSGELDVSDIDL